MQKVNVKKLAGLVNAYQNCIKSNNEVWKLKHEESIEDITANLPSGSGIDKGTKFDLAGSSSEKLVFYFSFHHMDQHGGYDGWTEHSLIITPSLHFGFKMRITGKDRNQIKDYLSDIFHEIFTIQ